MLIAEYKLKSPFGWEAPFVSLDSFISKYEDEAVAFSIHITEEWGGSIDLLNRAKQLTDKPLLAKGRLTYDEIQAAKKVGARPLLIEDLNTHLAADGQVIEVTSRAQIVAALKLNPAWVVVNARNLHTGEIDYGTHRRLRPHIPPTVIAVAASGLEVPRSDYDLSLIGTSLMESFG